MKIFLLLSFCLLLNTCSRAESNDYFVEVYLAALTASVSKPEDLKVKAPDGSIVYVNKKPTFAWREFKSVDQTTHLVGHYDKKTQEFIAEKVPCVRIVLNETDTKKLAAFKMPPHFQFAVKFSDEDGFFVFASMDPVVQDGILLLTSANLDEKTYQKLRTLVTK